MKAYAITIEGHSISEGGYAALKASSEAVGNDFEIERFKAITSDKVDEIMAKLDLKWNYPEKGRVWDEETQMFKSSYGGPHLRRVACALSHYMLWAHCVTYGLPILVLEHDAKFVKKFDRDIQKIISGSKYEYVGINDPRKATRKDQVFHNIVQSSSEPDLLDVPTIDDMKIPQGIAGASAYVVKPLGAREILDAVKEHGLWPNDAIVCQQLFPWLGVTKQYYTTIQGLKSTTFSNV